MRRDARERAGLSRFGFARIDRDVVCPIASVGVFDALTHQGEGF